MGTLEMRACKVAGLMCMLCDSRVRSTSNRDHLAGHHVQVFELDVLGRVQQSFEAAVFRAPRRHRRASARRFNEIAPHVKICAISGQGGDKAGLMARSCMRALLPSRISLAYREVAAALFRVLRDSARQLRAMAPDQHFPEFVCRNAANHDLFRVHAACGPGVHRTVGQPASRPCRHH